MQQWAAPQPRAHEVTAGHSVGGNAIEIHTPQQDQNTGSSSQTHIHCMLRDFVL